jgi:hypothetical protein
LRICKRNCCCATAFDFSTDRGGLTDAAFRERGLFHEREDEIVNPGLLRTVLTKRTAQSLARLEQAITVLLSYGGSWQDITHVTLAEKVNMLRDKASLNDYDRDEDAFTDDEIHQDES